MSSKLPQSLPVVPVKNDIIPITKRLVEERRHLVNSIVENVTTATACFGNVLHPIAELDNDQLGTRAIIEALRYASPDLDTQHMVEAAYKLWSNHYTDISKRLDFFHLVKAVGDKKESLDHEPAKLLKEALRRYTRCGHGMLGEDDVAALLKTRQDIKDLCLEFNRNVKEYDAGSMSFTDHELRGVPSSELEEAPIGDDGRRLIPLKYRQYTSIMTHAHEPNTRKRFQAAWKNRLLENIPIFKRTILLRDQNARLLGYKSHAAYRMQDHMAESTEWADELLENMAISLIPDSKQEFDRIEEKKREAMTTSPGKADETQQVKLDPWDVAYYSHILQAENAIAQEKISEYFPLKHTVKTMLGLFSSFLQLRFEGLPQEELAGHTWSDDVGVWSVWDERPGVEESFVGYLYSDLADRPNKYQGNQAVNLQPSYLRSDGSRVYPATTIMCNFSTLAPNGCHLLKHAHVKTLFHELGHCMHDLLARTKYTEFHGYAVRLEFGEAIGTMLENWCWIKEELQAMSCHYTRLDAKYMEGWMAANPGSPVPPERIPDELLDNLLKRRPRNRVNLYLQQVADSKFDLAVHNPGSHEALVNMDEARVFEDLNERVNFYRHPEPCYSHTGFTHFMSGYDAGYFVYMCANVFAEEMFQVNFAGRHRSQAAWDRFRRGILQYGGSREEKEVLEEFLGRPPTVVSLLRSIGIIPPRGLIPREGLCADVLARLIRRTALNPTFMLPLFILSRFTRRGSDLSALCPTAAAYLSRIFYFSAVRSLSSWLSSKVRNNWVSDRYDWSREVVVVTGGAAGIGGAVVRLFDEMGVTVVVLDVQRMTFAVSPRVHHFHCDLRSPENIATVASAIRSKVGHPTVLINNAGVSRGKTILDSSPADVRFTFDVNSLAHYWTVREFLPHMVARDHGMVVTVASIASWITVPNMVDYSATKAASLAFHHGLAAELVTHYNAPRVRTVVVHPGHTDTDLFAGFEQGAAFLMPRLKPESIADAIVKQVLSGRSGQVVLPAAGWMVSILGAIMPDWYLVRMRRKGQDFMKKWKGRQVIEDVDASFEGEGSTVLVS